ncbi:MAG: hypothetical protein SGJ10_03355 [Bacteroidota bacterium]|nr:hypothetical protein [Bacteroidota bacterium]
MKRLKLLWNNAIDTPLPRIANTHPLSRGAGNSSISKNHSIKNPTTFQQ